MILKKLSKQNKSVFFSLLLIILFSTYAHSITCDIDHSGRVDGNDLIIFSKATGTSSGDPNYKQELDFNNDGTIDEKDLTILTARFGFTGREFSLWAVDTNNNRIVKLSHETGAFIIESKDLYKPVSLTVYNDDGSLWVADTYNNRIINISPKGEHLRIISGFNRPQSISINQTDGTCWVADTNNDRVVKILNDITDSYNIIADSGKHVIITGFDSPLSVSVNDNDHSCWIADTSNNRIIKLDTNIADTYDINTTVFSEFHTIATGFNNPYCVSVNPADNTCWVADRSNNQIVKMSSNNSSELLRLSGFSGPRSVSVNPKDGTCWVADTSHDRIVRLSSTGAIISQTHDFDNPYAVAVNEWDGTCWVADTSNNQIAKILLNGTEAIRLNHFYSPKGLSVYSGKRMSGEPLAFAKIFPNVADISEPITYSGTAIDEDGKIVNYEWDFDGNGVFDWKSGNSGFTTYNYKSNGIYQPVFKVTDDSHLTSIYYGEIIRIGSFTAKASADKQSGIAPFQVNLFADFFEPSDGRVESYEWDFNNDGQYDYYSTSTGNTSYIYDQPGNYVATLKIKDAANSISKDYVYIKVLSTPPVAEASADTIYGVPPLLVNFSGAGNDDGVVLLYEWDFDGDGVFDWTGTENGNASFTYQKSGTYNAQLRITDNEALKGTAKVKIVANLPPTVLLKADTTKGNAILLVNFESIASDKEGDICLFEWDFDGDGTYDWTINNENKATYSYTSPGTYHAKLRVTDKDGETDEDSIAIKVIESGFPIADGTVDTTTGNFPLVCHFTGNGYDKDGNISLFEWGFGDEEHNGAFEDNMEMDNNNWIADSPWAIVNTDSHSPSASWHDSPGGNYASSANTSLTSKELDFTVAFNPKLEFWHHFETEKNYDYCRVEISRDNGQNWTALQKHHGSQPDWKKESIDLSEYEGSQSIKIRFRLTSDGGTQRDGWYIDDVKISGLAGFSWSSITSGQTSHTYEKPGTYYASFRVTDNDGNYDSEYIQIVVSEGLPDAMALASPTKGLVPLTVNFISEHSTDENGNIIQYDWFFGENIKTASLMLNYAFNSCIMDESNEPVDANINESLLSSDRFDSNKAALSFDGNNIIDLGNPLKLQLTHNQTISMWLYPTDFSDRRNPYAKAYGGEGTITIEKNGQVNYYYGTCGGNCSTYQGFTMTSPISANEWVHLVLVRDLDNMVLKWFKNGELVNTANAHYSFAQKSTLNAFIGSGYTNKFKGKMDDFQIYNTALSDSEILQMYNTSNISSQAPDWTSMTSGNTTYTYTHPGVFYATLRVTDNDGYVDYDRVKIIPQSLPQPQIIAPKNAEEYSRDVIFNAKAQDIDGHIVLYEWDFDNNGIYDYTSEKTANTFFTYEHPGLYTATLRVMDNDDYISESSVCFTIKNINPIIKELIAEPQKANAPVTIHFNSDTYDSDGKIIQYEWDFNGDGIFDYVNKFSQNVNHEYETQGDYYAVLRITDNNNSTAEKSVHVRINTANSPQAIASVTPQTIYTNESAKFDGHESAENIVSYEWDFENDGIIDWQDITSGEVISYSSYYSSSWEPSHLIDGKVGSYAGWSSSSYPTYPQDITFSLPNNEIFTIDRVCMNPYTTDSSSYWAKDVEIYVSDTNTDSENFTKICEFQLQPSNTEQFFSFDPVDAMYVRLRLLSSQNSTRYVQLGEFKVFAQNAQDNLLAMDGIVYHTYEKHGIYQALLKVKNEQGLTDQAIVHVNVHPEGENISKIWVADYANNLVKKLTADGQEIFRVSGFNKPYDLDVYQNEGSCWVVDKDHNQVVKLSGSTGDEITRVSGFNSPHSISVNQNDGSCWIADYSNSQIVKLNPQGVEIARENGFNNPISVSVNATDGSCWVADYNNHHVVKLSFDGEELLRIRGFDNPRDISVDPLDGSCWVADRDHAQIVKLLPDVPNHYNISLSGVEIVDDSSINNNTGTRKGDASIVHEGIFGNAARLDGNGDCITVPFNANYRPYTQITLESWFYAENWNSDDVAVLSTTHSGGWALYKDNDLFKFLIEIDNTYYQANFPVTEITLKQWHHIAGSFDGNLITLYYDGEVKQEIETTGTISYGYNNAMQIGAEASSSTDPDNNYFNGMIDDVRIWSRSLDQTEIQRNMNKPLEGNKNGLVGYWKFEAQIGIFHKCMGGFNQPTFVSVNASDGTCLVSDYSSNQVIKISKDCQNVLFQAGGFYRPYMLSTNPLDGTCWVPDHSHSKIVKLSPNGSELIRLSGFRNPTAIAIDTGINELTNAPTAKASADCISGTIPLLVNFFGTGTSEKARISFYEWDFDGDGIYDSKSQNADNISFTYTEVGNYNAVLRVTDSNNLVSHSSIMIYAGEIKAVATASVTRGDTVLNVNFDGYGISAFGRIDLFEWDFDGDGIFDWSSSSTAKVNNHKYYTGGLYLATLKVTNSLDQTDQAVIPITVNRVKPVAVSNVSTNEGEPPLSVWLYGSDSYDSDGSIVLFEWDYDGDGVFDYFSETTANKNYIYKTGGEFYPTLRVTDNEGLMSQVRKKIVVGNILPVVKIKTDLRDNKGNAPLTVQFSGDIQDTDGSILLYEWNFGDFHYIKDKVENGLGHWINDDDWNITHNVSHSGNACWTSSPDGFYENNTDSSLQTKTFDFSSAVLPILSFWHKYDFEQDFDFGKVEIRTSDSWIEIQTFTGIQNEWQQVYINLGEYAGSDKVTLRFHVTSDDFFNREGWYIDDIRISDTHTFMHQSTESPNIQKLFEEPGIYQVSLRVKDNNNGITTDSIQIIVNPQGSPTAIASASPVSGGSPLDVTFHNSDSFDSGGNIVKFEWDFGDLFKIESAGYHDGNDCAFYVKGVSTGTNNSGFNLVVIDPVTLNILDTLYFDTYSDEDASFNMAHYIAGLPEGTIVLFAVKNDASKKLNEQAHIALESMGSQLNRQLEYRDSYALIGIKGAKQGSVWETIHKKYDGKVVLQGGAPTWRSPTSREVVHTYNKPGSYMAKLKVTDDSGLIDTTTVAINVGNPQAFPGAYPLSGKYPLVVKFTSNAIDHDGTIEFFHWDCNGDGINDQTFRVSDTFEFTYNLPGIYKARLQVIDNDGLTDEKSIIIQVTGGTDSNAPIALAMADPVYGSPPLTVNFMGRSTDNNGTIENFQWDFDGDGTVDWQSNENGQATHTFLESGIYKAIFKTTDNDGLSTSETVRIKVQPEGNPLVQANADTPVGTSSLEVSFEGSISNANNITGLYEWDFDGDGNFDWSSEESPNVNYQYSSPGIYEAVLKFTDSTGIVDYAWTDVVVEGLDIKSMRNREAFDPQHGERITISTCLNFSTSAYTLRIVSPDGTTVKTILNNIQRTSGVYVDEWDGRDNNGHTVTSGLYYFVIDYQVGDKTYHYDLTKDSGNKITITPTYSNVFNPVEDQFLTATFTLEKPAQISAYVSPFNGNAASRIRTLYLMTPKKSGNYVITWDGAKDNGNLASFDQAYVIAFFAYELSENAIIVENNPIVSDVSTDPDYYNPANPYKKEFAAINYNLSKEADIRVQIYNDLGIRMRTLNFSDVMPGNHVINWDGKNNSGILVDQGLYSIAIKAIDSSGQESMPVNGIVKIFY